MWPWNSQHHQLFCPDSRWMDVEPFVGDGVVNLKPIWYLLIIISSVYPSDNDPRQNEINKMRTRTATEYKKSRSLFTDCKAPHHSLLQKRTNH